MEQPELVVKFLTVLGAPIEKGGFPKGRFPNIVIHTADSEELPRSN